MSKSGVRTRLGHIPRTGRMKPPLKETAVHGCCEAPHGWGIRVTAGQRLVLACANRPGAILKGFVWHTSVWAKWGKQDGFRGVGRVRVGSGLDDRTRTTRSATSLRGWLQGTVVGLLTAEVVERKFESCGGKVGTRKAAEVHFKSEISNLRGGHGERRPFASKVST